MGSAELQSGDGQTFDGCHFGLGSNQGYIYECCHGDQQDEGMSLLHTHLLRHCRSRKVVLRWHGILERSSSEVSASERSVEAPI